MGADSTWEPPRRRRVGRPLVVVVAAAAVVGVTAQPWQSALPGQDAHDLRVEADGRAGLPADVRRISELSPGSLVPGSWTRFTGVKLEGRWDASMTWTGREAVVWGGAGAKPLADGAAMDPATGAWTWLPEGPLSPRFGHAAVWTGREVVIAGGSSRLVPGGEPVADLADAAAYDPTTGEWRTLPRLPFATRRGHLFAFEGRLLALASDITPQWLAVLEPAAHEWVEMPVPRPGGIRGGTEAVLDVGVAHDELVVWNRRREGAGAAVSLRDPSQWRPLHRAAQPMTDIASCCELVGSEARDGAEVITYDRIRDVWRPLGERNLAQLVVTEDLVVLVDLEGASGALDRQSGTPLRLPPSPLSPRRGAAAAWIGDRILLWGGIGPAGAASDGAWFIPA